MGRWVLIAMEEGDDPVEIPTEADGTIFLESVTAQFPDVTGLKYKNPETGNFRGIRCIEKVLHPPDEEEGWGNVTYICTMPKTVKRKPEEDESMDYMSMKTQRMEGLAPGGKKQVSDLIVIGLAFRTTEAQIKEYFSKFGELARCDLKLNPGTKDSRGYAFIRFKERESQDKAMMVRHFLDEKWVDAKIPESQTSNVQPWKIHLNNVSEDITYDDIKSHFEKFGKITEVYVPKPHKNFAFVSFADTSVAESLLWKVHEIKGRAIEIGQAATKQKGPRDVRPGQTGSGEYVGGNPMEALMRKMQQQQQRMWDSYNDYGYGDGGFGYGASGFGSGGGSSGFGSGGNSGYGSGGGYSSGYGSGGNSGYGLAGARPGQGHGGGGRDRQGGQRRDQNQGGGQRSGGGQRGNQQQQRGGWDLNMMSQLMGQGGGFNPENY